mmetsp:Transcript_32998/g.84262  ORF Transcript_32998/g.84262 Transcript_32998/m.84262 type:complete len:102 (-) Transcript_32998:2064-2369(-)
MHMNLLLCRTATTGHRCPRNSDDDVVVQREGGQTGDYVIQRACAQNLQGLATVLFREPLKLLDKTAASHFAAARDLCGLGLECGLRCLNIQHTVLDSILHC